jgi:glutamate-1-semialdehyde aminotransferase
LIKGVNKVIREAGVPGAAYGLASYFHITLGQEVTQPTDGVEWPATTLPRGMARPVQSALKRAMLNQGVDLMGGAGGFVSGVHTIDDIKQTIASLGSAIRALQADEVL